MPRDQTFFIGGRRLQIAPYQAEERTLNRVLGMLADDGLILQHLSLDLKNKSEIIFAAVQQCQDALQYASGTLKNNRDFMLSLFACDYESEEYLDFSHFQVKGCQR